MHENTPLALEAYEKLAEAYARRIDTKPHNAFYDRPATLSLLPDIKGKKILDAGCGPGVYAEELINRGAQVTGIDISPNMLAQAKKRVGKKAVFHLVNLEEPLTLFGDGTFDLVLCPLALDYMRSLGPIFTEYFRVLKRGGWLIFSQGHPFADFLFWKKRNQTDDYFSTEKVGCDWNGFGESVYVPSIRRPLNKILNPLARAGFRLDKLLEPQPVEKFRKADPELYLKLMHEPGFICVRAQKP